MVQVNNAQQQSISTHDEQILVVKRSHLFPDDGAWHGLRKVDFEHYMHIIDHKKEFHPRSVMENDPAYKQIIPYLVFQHDNTFFLMQRRSTASEERLRNKLTLGIGGHIRKEDMTHNSIFSWATREFHEEVDYAGTFTIQPIGIINDDSNDVGKVHIGFVFLLTGNIANITVKSELKNGSLIPLSECIAQKESMETWSQFILNELEFSSRSS